MVDNLEDQATLDLYERTIQEVVRRIDDIIIFH